MLWIEILSEDDKILVENGVPYAWIIDPITLESQLRTSAGCSAVADKTLRLPNSRIVVPLPDVIED